MFVTDNDFSPISRLVEGSIVSDASCEVKRLLLLVQKDSYSFPRDALWPLTNLDLDRWWDKLFRVYAGRRNEENNIILCEQIGDNGELAPFGPLFFCGKKQAFFHPPCPHCGSPLEQCYDDTTLSGLGLELYSGSLKRYLFCPSCFSLKGVSEFYEYSLTPSRRKTVRDHLTLLRSLGALETGVDAQTRFPCADCGMHSKCYGAEVNVLSNISIFSFYPFRFLIYDAACVNIIDFLALLSGASFFEIEGRLNSQNDLLRKRCLEAARRNPRDTIPFMFRDKSRLFLEILHRKAALLFELYRILLDGVESGIHPKMELSPLGIWIRFKDREDVLPPLWEFELQTLSLSPMRSGFPHPLETTPCDALQFMARVWFCAFLVNKRQSVRSVHQSLRGRMEKLLKEGNAFQQRPMWKSDPAFSPAQNFWDQENTALDEPCLQLWERVLAMGESMLRGAMPSAPAWPNTEFERDFEDLRENIRSELLRERQSSVANPAAHREAAIAGILSGLIIKWRSQEHAGNIEKTVFIASNEKMAQENSFITPLGDGNTERLNEKPSEQSLFAKSADVDEGELQRTVISSLEAMERLPSAPGSEPQTIHEEGTGNELVGLEKTVILSQQQIERLSSPSDPQDNKDSLAKTRIIRYPKDEGEDG